MRCIVIIVLITGIEKIYTYFELFNLVQYYKLFFSFLIVLTNCEEHQFFFPMYTLFKG